MELTSRLTRPFKKHKASLIGKVGGFVDPIKRALVDLRGKMPSPKGFAGSEELASEDFAENGKITPKKESPIRLGLLARLKNFKDALKGMSDFQKLILLTIAICLPAGILISTILVSFIKKHKRK